MSGHRQAALALYSLGGEDQDLILAELPATDAAQLRAGIAELNALGFEASVPAAAPARLFSLAPRTPLSAQDRVRAASAPALAELLSNEPAALIAEVLAGHDWPWRGELLELLAPARRTLVQRAIDARMRLPAAPACHAFLVTSIAERIDSIAVPAPASVLSRLLHKATSWKR